MFNRRLSIEARRLALVTAVIVTLGSVAFSEMATALASLTFHLDAGIAAYLIAGIVPALLAGPGSYWQCLKLEELKQAYRHLDHVASMDWLTQCLNRRAFTTAVMAAVDTGRRGALLVIDADNFKAINDVFGHDHGDQALRQIAEVIRNSVRLDDVVGRLGGEEFGIFATDISRDGAYALAERIREAVADIAFEPGAVPHSLSVSIGIAASDEATTFSDLFRLADQQLYAAKRDGRNRVAVATAANGLAA